MAQFINLSDFNIENYSFKFSKKTNQVGIIWIQPAAVSVQLNTIETDGWMSAPYGVSCTENKKRLTLETHSAPLIERVRVIEDYVQLKVEENKALWFDSKKVKPEMSRSVNVSDTGRTFLRVKYVSDGYNAVRVWVGSPSGQLLSYREGCESDINSSSLLAVRVKLWGIWTYGNKYGLGISAEEVMVIRHPRLNAPSLNLPYTSIEECSANEDTRSTTSLSGGVDMSDVVSVTSKK